MSSVCMYIDSHSQPLPFLFLVGMDDVLLQHELAEKKTESAWFAKKDW